MKLESVAKRPAVIPATGTRNVASDTLIWNGLVHIAFWSSRKCFGAVRVELTYLSSLLGVVKVRLSSPAPRGSFAFLLVGFAVLSVGEADFDTCRVADWPLAETAALAKRIVTVKTSRKRLVTTRTLSNSPPEPLPSL